MMIPHAKAVGLLSEFLILLPTNWHKGEPLNTPTLAVTVSRIASHSCPSFVSELLSYPRGELQHEEMAASVERACKRRNSVS
jgi:hypothetical protein